MLNTILPTSIIKLNNFETWASFPFNQTEPQQRVAGYRYFIYFGVVVFSGNWWGNIFYLRCNYITVIIGKSREAAAILTNMAIQQFDEISLSLNSNKSVSISIEHDHLDQRPLSMNSYHNIRSLQKGEKFLISELSFLIKYSYTQIK